MFEPSTLMRSLTPSIRLVRLVFLTYHAQITGRQLQRRLEVHSPSVTVFDSGCPVLAFHPVSTSGTKYGAPRDFRLFSPPDWRGDIAGPKLAREIHIYPGDVVKGTSYSATGRGAAGDLKKPLNWWIVVQSLAIRACLGNSMVSDASLRYIKCASQVFSWRRPIIKSSAGIPSLQPPISPTPAV